MIIECN